MKRLLIVGGGFAGTWAALAAASEADRLGTSIHISLLSREPYLTNRPRLYETPTDDLRFPLEEILDRAGVEFIQGEAVAIDTSRRRVRAGTNRDEDIEAPYDRLVVTTGSALRELPIPGFANVGFDIDSFEAASRLERHLRSVLTETDRPGHACVVVVGGGFTGIELATELRPRIAQIAGDAFADSARIVVVERADSVGHELGVGPRPAILEALDAARVEVRTEQGVARVTRDMVELSDGTRIPCSTVIGTAGLHASSLATELSSALDELGRLPTDDYLRVVASPGVFAAGDVARAEVDDEHVALMSCQHAMPMGKIAGCNAARDLLDLPLHRFRHSSYVTCLDLGAAGAVFTTGWDRQVVMQGLQAKELKKKIVTETIAPPSGTRTEILSAAAVEPGDEQTTSAA